MGVVKVLVVMVVLVKVVVDGWDGNKRWCAKIGNESDKRKRNHEQTVTFW